ncbi:MAG: hypothetical protein HPY69_20235, partial [Armatimonadetes bacterium]|nr:hypothetical protein [Armatimonadota bacterium]
MTEKPLGSKDIRLIEDQPIGGGDGTELLGLEPFARVMARVALGTTGPFTIGVYAGWGQGKTSLLKRTRHLVEAEGRLDTVAVWFNAWQYEREEHPLFPLIAAIADAVQGKRKVASFFDDLHTCLNGLLTGLKLSAKPFGVGGELDVGKAIEADEELRDSVLKRETVCMEEFRRLERTTENSKGEVKVIVFIDDLDRCLPDKALALLESIKLVLNQPGFIFLLALDYRIVVSFLAKEYREKYGITDETEAERIAATYLDKIVQWQLDVPHHAPRFRDFLRGLAGREDLKGTRVSEIIRILAPDDPDSEEDAPPSLLALGADYNPRSLVRLLNSLLVDSALWEAMHEGQAEPKPDEKDVLVCMTVTHVLRQPQHLGHARARALAMSDRLCEALLVETSGARDETPATMAEGRGRSPDDDALERIVRADKQVYELLTGQGRVWLENHELRKSVYDFVERQRPVPEDQQAIFERAVRNAVGLEPDAPIPPERLRDLATLDFTGESDFGDAGLRLVAGVPGLQELRLNGTQVSDQGLQHLANLTSLQGLHLSDTQISDQGLQHLANLTSLQ